MYRTRKKKNELDCKDISSTSREEIHKPDLYIPSMALITFILLMMIYEGTDRE